MATMIKEKRREKKKKAKEKPAHVPIEVNDSAEFVEELNTSELSQYEIASSEFTIEEQGEASPIPDVSTLREDCNISDLSTIEKNSEMSDTNPVESNIKTQFENLNITEEFSSPSLSNYLIDTSAEIANISQEYETCDVSIKSSLNATLSDDISTENVVPSAPVFNEPIVKEVEYCEEVTDHVPKVISPKLECIPLEEAARVFAGTEMIELRAMSEREESFVEAGPMCGPEHPLVDLLDTFRCSLKSMEREKVSLISGFLEIEKLQANLWQVEKKKVSESQKCSSCNSYVTCRATYEIAVFLRNQLPVAKMRLESLLRDIQDSYCHYQHAALLAHCQIEEIVSETIQTSKQNIREALSLVLKELRAADSEVPVLADALQRWAKVLATALVDGRDLRQLLYLIHHLSRQNRSVHWAASLLHLPISDHVEVARAIVIMDLLLKQNDLELALECNEEESSSAWEEISTRGGAGGAVVGGALRERDLRAALHAMQHKHLVARLALVRHSDISECVAYEWGDASGGRGVLKAACGTRVLLHVLHRAVCNHPYYEALARDLVEMGVQAVAAIADLDEHSRETYKEDLRLSLQAELHACFAALFTIVAKAASSPRCLPFRVLNEQLAEVYYRCMSQMLHETTERTIDGADVVLTSQLSCSWRLNAVVQLAVDRPSYEIAGQALKFIMEIGLKRKAACRGGCDVTARAAIRDVLNTHTYLYSVAFKVFADLYLSDNIDPTNVKHLSPEEWRPTPQDALLVLNDYSSRCAGLLQHLLLSLDYTPKSGVSLASQSAIGEWLVAQFSLEEAPPWAWRVMTQLKLHRLLWGLPLDGSPAAQKGGLYRDAYNVCATDWAHCVPLVCGAGVSALQSLCAAGHTRMVAIALSNIMLVMTQSPDSIALTPGFVELLSSISESGPSLVQRALGRGSAGAHALLRKIIRTHITDSCRKLQLSPAAVCESWLQASHCRASAVALAETAALAHCDRTHLEQAAFRMVLGSNSKDLVDNLVKNAASAPIVCCTVLRALSQMLEPMFARLLDALHQQVLANAKPHVDNALKSIGSEMPSEELVIHRAVCCALLAPLNSPGHLQLWALIMQIYLRRPPSYQTNTTPPIGPLFFSGLIKSRTLRHMKRRVEESVTHHQSEIDRLKQELQSNRSTVTPSADRRNVSSKTDKFLQSLTLRDLTGEAVEESESSCGSDEGDSEEEKADPQRDERMAQLRKLMDYHEFAKSSFQTFQSWLAQGAEVRAYPHHVAPVPDHLFSAACKAELDRLSPPSSPDDDELDPFPRAPSRAATLTVTAFDRMKARLAKYGPRRFRKQRRKVLKSPIEEFNVKNPKNIVQMVDKYLRDVESFAEEWSKEVSRVSRLDAELWKLCAELRVSRPAPPLRKACTNHCGPVVFAFQLQEWVISPSTERAIQENRFSAKLALTRLTTARPGIAKTVAALHTLARQVNSGEMAVAVSDRAWRSAGPAVERCAGARDAVSRIVTYVAEKWLSQNAPLCSALMSRWGGGGALQRRLMGEIIHPRALADWTILYRELLKYKGPPDAVFSYLSKFEMHSLCERVTVEQRQCVLDALVEAVVSYGPDPPPDTHMLLELVGVHTVSALCPALLPRVILLYAGAAADGRLRPAHWTHLNTALDNMADLVGFEQLGNCLRSLGEIWSSVSQPPAVYAAHAPHIARLLGVLNYSFVNAAYNMHYSLERVSWYGWSGLMSSWRPWVSERAGRPPPVTPAADLLMVQHYCRQITALLAHCQGNEAYILREVWEWATSFLPLSNPQWTQDNRIRLTCILAELAKLPWTQYQWFSCTSMESLLKVWSSGDKDSWCWSCGVLSGARAWSWLGGVHDQHLSTHLTHLFYVLTDMPFMKQTLDEAKKLPWYRMPVAALEPALERFFAEHHNVNVPYHTLDQFSLVLTVSELYASAQISTQARDKRCALIAQWTRAVSAPGLRGGAAGEQDAILKVLTDIEPTLQSSEGELEELMSRAISVLCTEPAGTTCLPVWQKWVSNTTSQLRLVCLSAMCSLTVLQHFADLAETCVKAYMECPESSWSSIQSRWQPLPWRSCGALSSRGLLFAAYGTLCSHPPDDQDLTTLLLALTAGNVHFTENEPILAVFSCYAARVCVTSRAEEGPRAAARALLRGLAEGPSAFRRAFAIMAGGRPTDRLCLLARYALLILDPTSELLLKNFFSASNTALGSNAEDVAHWTKSPALRKLPKLAMILYPKYERYFKFELEKAEQS